MHRAARECEKTVRSRLRVAVTNAFWARKNAYLFRFLRAAREPSRPFVPVRAVSGAREKQWRDGGGQHWRRDGGQHWRGRLVRRELTCRPRAYLSGRSGPAPAPAPAREKAHSGGSGYLLRVLHTTPRPTDRPAGRQAGRQAGATSWPRWR